MDRTCTQDGLKEVELCSRLPMGATALTTPRNRELSVKIGTQTVSIDHFLPIIITLM